METVPSGYIGQTLDDRYLIRELVGSGGMSRVFLADDLVMHRSVAIKMLREDIASDGDALRRFVHEAKAVSMLSHPNIVSVYDVAMSSKDKYIVLEYAVGVTLKDYLREKGPLSASEAIHIATQILSGLEHAHGKQIIHRDIKPQNIIISPSGSIKVTDFGIAKLPHSETISMTDKAIGSVHYISPEQASAKQVDHRSDLYSVGIILYEMVCNRLPFDGETAVAVACKQISESPIHPSSFIKNVPIGLEQVILKAMSKRPDDRFDNAGQMLACLERLESTPEAVFDFVTIDHSDDDEAVVIGSSQTDDDLYGTDAEGPDFINATPTTNKDSEADSKKKNRKKIVEKEIIIKKDRFSMFPIILGMLCAIMSVLLVCGVYLLQTYFIDGGSEARVLVVDDFVSQIYSDEMKQELEAMGYSVEVEWVMSTDHLANSIISQEPEENARRTVIPGKQPCRLKLVVCKGENLMTLPDYTGIEYRQAQIEMMKNDLNYTVERVYHSSVPEGMIVSTYPKAGTVITADTKVVVYVSRGAKVSYVTVPRLIGHTAAEVSELLKNAGLRVGKVTYEYSDTVEAGLIISQSLTPGITVQSGLTTVDMVVSLGPQFILPPDDPSLPDDPALPDNPTIPNTPNIPVLPDDPSVPDDSAPDTPVIPNQTDPPVTESPTIPDGNDPNIE